MPRRPWISLLVVALLAPTLSAQEPERGRATDFDREIVWPKFPDAPEDAPDARLAVYFDLVSRTRSLGVEPNEPFEFFIVAHDPHVAVLAWELKLTVDERLTILEEDIKGGVNIGGDGEYRVGIQPENCEGGDQVVLARFKAMLREPGGDLLLKLGPVTNASVKEPDRPCYATCRAQAELRPFAYEATAAVVNPVSIQLEEERPTANLFEPKRGR